MRAQEAHEEERRAQEAQEEEEMRAEEGQEQRRARRWSRGLGKSEKGIRRSEGKKKEKFRPRRSTRGKKK